jgi:hypothetical protein
MHLTAGSPQPRDADSIREPYGATESSPDYAAVISATLDTSCALNFLMSDEEPDEDLIEMVSLALVGRISLKVSEEAFHEVQGTADPDKRARRIARLEAFGRLTIPKHQESEREALASRLHAAIFPNAKPGSRSDEHNQRDCRQLVEFSKPTPPKQGQITGPRKRGNSSPVDA